MRAAHALRRQAQAGTPRIPADAPPATPLPDDPCLRQTRGQSPQTVPGSGQQPSTCSSRSRSVGPSRWPEQAEPRHEE